MRPRASRSHRRGLNEPVRFPASRLDVVRVLNFRCWSACAFNDHGGRATRVNRLRCGAAQSDDGVGRHVVLVHGMRFRIVGPPRGGGVTTVTGVPSAPRARLYGCRESGGLFERPSGPAWEPITDGKVSVVRRAVAAAESDPNDIYLGTGSDDIRLQCVDRARHL